MSFERPPSDSTESSETPEKKASSRRSPAPRTSSGRTSSSTPKGSATTPAKRATPATRRPTTRTPADRRRDESDEAAVESTVVAESAPKVTETVETIEPLPEGTPSPEPASTRSRKPATTRKPAARSTTRSSTAAAATTADQTDGTQADAKPPAKAPARKPAASRTRAASPAAQARTGTTRTRTPKPVEQAKPAGQAKPAELTEQTKPAEQTHPAEAPVRDAVVIEAVPVVVAEAVAVVAEPLAVEEAPVIEEVPFIEEAPVVAEAPVIAEAPVAAETIAVEETVPVEEIAVVDSLPPMTEEPPAIEGSPVVDAAPLIEEAFIVEDAVLAEEIDAIAPPLAELASSSPVLAATTETPVAPDAATAPIVLSLTGLVKRFGDTIAVDGVSLDVRRGSFYGIVGPNGAGKTTTLSMVTGLLRPDAGSIHVHGVDAWADPVKAKRTIGVLPDKLRLFDRLTGAQLLYYSGTLRGLKNDVVRTRSADLAKALGIEDALNRLVADYSAGMTKKIALAAAMIHSPRLLVLDEPFESVDPVSAANVIDILQRYVASGGTVVLSSHGMDLIQRVCDSVAIIVRGRVLAAGTVDQVRGEQTLEERFVELAGGRKAAEGMEWLHSFSD